jgi:protocatechuate 3,4-dioxygenase beta subunit
MNRRRLAPTSPPVPLSCEAVLASRASNSGRRGGAERSSADLPHSHLPARSESRRHLLARIVGTASLLVLSQAWLAGAVRAACGAFGTTPAQTEGPYYKRNPPQRASLREPGVRGEALQVTGRVLDRQCRPVANAQVDFWHADTAGEYDNAGYRLRGFQLTDADGRFRLQTILPGVYPGRTRHIHVKITPPRRRTLTTQLYFPNEPENARDGIYDPALVMRMSRTAEGQVGEYEFVVDG